VRIRTLHVSQVPPIQHFSVDGISDVLVVAGPNGVGKTRLIQVILEAFQRGNPHPNVRMVVEATCDEERTAWTKTLLDTQQAADVATLMRTLQPNRVRTSSSSSIFQFESDRTIQQLQPYNFTWDYADPFAESIGWGVTISRLRDRFQDTVHSLFRKVRARREQIALRGEESLKRGDTTMSLAEFTDPLEPFKTAFSQLLGPKQLVDPEPREQQLFYTIDGSRFPITALSSGEREVLNIAFDTILRNPSNSIIFFDEPELHLHPELSYKLLQTLRTIGPNNQLIFCTHSAEIITASLDNTVVFIAPPREPPTNQALVVREDDDTHQALKMLGQSIGIIALGKKLVLVEGLHASLDKQTYGTILKNRFPNLVLVASGGKGIITSFATLMSDILERTIWGVQFFMLCDRDAISLARSATDVEDAGRGRLRVLGRYHLENYFLDETILATIFETMEPDGSWLRSPARIKERLEELARSMISYATALIVSAQYREQTGNVDMMPNGCHEKSADQLVGLMVDRLNSEKARVAAVLDPQTIEASVRAEYRRLEQSIEGGQDEWKNVIPGKQLLSRFASLTNLDAARLKRLYLQEAATRTLSPFEDIVRIFDSFDRA